MPPHVLGPFWSRRHWSLATVVGYCLFLVILCSASGLSQAAPPSTTGAPKPEVAKDPLGRTTPRGTVRGFLAAARKGDNDTAAQYLNTHQSAKTASVLAAQLFVVLDRRLPARLNELSDNPEGNGSDPLNPNQYLVGRINGTEFDIFLERVERKNIGPIWLFSATSLKSVPDIYDQTNVGSIETFLPASLVNNRIADIPLYEWVALLIGLPSLYMVTVLLNWLLSSVVGLVRRRLYRNPELANPTLLFPPIRLFIVAAVIRILLSRVGLSLLARQFWKTATAMIVLVACAWLLILLNSRSEQYLRNYLQRRNLSGIVSVQRLIRRMIDVAIIVSGVLVALEYFGVNLSAALAGLGVGGIAVALAAQKTLENIIAGISLIVDKAVRVGDSLKVGNIAGTVVDVGLRSTRLRTQDRTVVNIPNGQIANMSLEVLSARDKFCFNPTIPLTYETTSTQICSVVDGIRSLLSGHAQVEINSVRVRFFRITSCSFDVEIFAYLYALDWNQFLEIQEELLHGIMGVVQQNGARLAFPSQTLYFANNLMSPAEATAKSSNKHDIEFQAAATHR